MSTPVAPERCLVERAAIEQGPETRVDPHQASAPHPLCFHAFQRWEAHYLTKALPHLQAPTNPRTVCYRDGPPSAFSREEHLLSRPLTPALSTRTHTHTHTQMRICEGASCMQGCLGLRPAGRGRAPARLPAPGASGLCWTQPGHLPTLLAGSPGSRGFGKAVLVAATKHPQQVLRAVLLVRGRGCGLETPGQPKAAPHPLPAPDTPAHGEASCCGVALPCSPSPCPHGRERCLMTSHDPAHAVLMSWGDLTLSPLRSVSDSLQRMHPGFRGSIWTEGFAEKKLKL